MRNSLILLACILSLMSACSGDKKPVDKSKEEFYSLMGDGTKHWSHIVQQEDRSFLEACKRVYEKSSKELASARRSVKIPKTIHFIWLGPKAFPPESVENVRMWMAQNPDWTVKFWTDRDRPTPCRGMQKVFVKDFNFSRLGHCYIQSQNYGEKSDILRYEILNQEGGVYVDHDANCLQPFLPLHTAYDFYCGLETPHEPFVGQSVTCGNGVIGSRPNHPALRKVIDLIAQHWEGLGKKYQGRDSYSRTEVVMQRTYIALTNALKEDILNRDSNVDIVLPASYFFAKSGMPSLYSKHFYATAWSDQKVKSSAGEKFVQKKMDKISQKTSNMRILAFLLLACNLSLAAALIWQLRRGDVKKA
ncbi:MAG: hypothetical protein HYX48_03870 [Chlamydiales bacterium]|nr:hypothetical protein [Chlamydiales bacterium]